MDVRRLKPAARLGFGDYAVIERVFTLPRPTRADALGVAAANLPIPPVWRTGNNRAVVAFPPVTPLAVALASLVICCGGTSCGNMAFMSSRSPRSC